MTNRNTIILLLLDYRSRQLSGIGFIQIFDEISAIRIGLQRRNRNLPDSESDISVSIVNNEDLSNFSETNTETQIMMLSKLIPLLKILGQSPILPVLLPFKLMFKDEHFDRIT